MWSVAEDVWVMGHLLLLSLQDIRDRELSFAVLLEFLVHLSQEQKSVCGRE